MADDVAREALADLDRVSQAATGLSRQLQLFGSRAALRPTTVDLNDIIGAGAEGLADLVSNEVELELRLGTDVRAATTDADQVSHVLQVLLSNAREAMPKGGALRGQRGPPDG